MKKKNFPKILISCIAVIASFVISCSNRVPDDRSKYTVLDEKEISEIPLKGELADRRAEFSGLTWYNDMLVLLPQYPQLFGTGGEGALFAIEKSELQKCKDENFSYSPDYKKIKVNFNGLDPDLMGEGSGCEAIVFRKNEAFLAIECRTFFSTGGCIIKAVMDEQLLELKLLPESIQTIEAQTDISNLAEETIFYYGDKVYTVYEANGLNINPAPVAHVFDFSLTSCSTLPIENLEYRITDATLPDSLGNFWVINYLWPDDEDDLNPALDKEFMNYGIGKSHKNVKSVERLVEYKVTEEKIVRTLNPPIYFKIKKDDNSRNWEGLVRFEDGFLIITDKYPRTILGYFSNN